MSDSEEPGHRGPVSELLQADGRLLKRLSGVFRLDPDVYREIEQDPMAIPQSFAVVIGTVLLAGLGQSSIAGIFLWIAGALFLWMMAVAMIWGVGLILVGEASDYTRLLRCLGFAYAWFALLLGYALPWIGWLFGWSAVGLALTSFMLATRQVLRVSTGKAVAICVIALGLPLLVIQIAT